MLDTSPAPFYGSAWKCSQAAACPGWEGGCLLPGRAREESIWHRVPEQAWSQAFSTLPFATLSIPVYFRRAWREAPVLWDQTVCVTSLHSPFHFLLEQEFPPFLPLLLFLLPLVLL